MPLTRIDSAFLDLDAIGGIDFDVNNSVPTLKVDATTHRVGIGHNSPETQLHMFGSYPTLRIQNSATAQYASASIDLQGPAGDERHTKILHGNSNTGGTETYFQIEQLDSSGSYVKTLTQYSYQYDHWLFLPGGTERLKIDSTGIDVTGHTETDTLNVSGVSTFNDHVNLPDNTKIMLGASNDLQLLHLPGTGNSIQGDQPLYLQSPTQVILKQYNGSEVYAKFTKNASVELYYDNSKKFETTSTGVDISGDISIADKIIHTGDQDTAIRFPANDTFTVETAGQERIRVDSSGRVGIGTVSPSNMLEIYGSTPTIELTDSDTGVIHRINANSGAGIWYFDNDINNVGSDGSYVFRHGHANGGGTVLTISPAGTLTLGAGSGTIRRSGDTDTYINFDGSDDIRFVTANSEQLRINGSGNVGIGTNAPTEKLHVLGSAIISSDAAANSSQYATLVLGERPAGDAYASLEFKYDGTGISAKIDGRDGGLDVWANWNSTDGERLKILGTSASEDVILRPGTVNVIKASHNTSTGVSATYFKGVAHFQRTDTANEGADIRLSRAVDDVSHYSIDVYGNSATNPRLRLVNVTASREDFTLTHDGNVGIGINNPGTKLQVNGVITASNTRTYEISDFENTTEFNETILNRSFDNATPNPPAQTTSQSNKYGSVNIFGYDSARRTILAHDYDGDNLYFARQTVSGNPATVAQSWQKVVTSNESGNVGIGTNNPGAKLHVESAATTAGWQIRTDSVGLSNESGFYRDASDHYEMVLRNGLGGLSFIKNDGGASTANLRFTVQGSENLTISSSGNVGIGTATPDYKLHVEGRPLFTTGLQVSTISQGDLNSRANIHSGFYQADNASTMSGWPFTGWAHLTSNTHSNGSNYYSQQFASSFFNQELYFRNTNSGTTTTSQSWGQVMHTNSTLKPVYAESSGNTDNYSRYWYPGGEYYVSVHGITAPGDMNNMLEQGYYHVANNASNNPTSAYGYLNLHRHAGSQYSLQHFIVSGDTSRQWMRASYPDAGGSNGRSWYQWYSYGALERENQFTNRQNIIGPTSTSTFTGLNAPTNNNRAQLVLHSDYSDLVISSAQTNTNGHGSTLSFAASNPANAADYNKFIICKGNWGTRTEMLSFGYENIEHSNPHTYINASDNVMTLDGQNKRVGIGAKAEGYQPAYPLDVNFDGDSGVRIKGHNSHASLYIDAPSGNGGYIRFRQAGVDEFWITNDSNNDLAFRPNGGGTTVKFFNSGEADFYNNTQVYARLLVQRNGTTGVPNYTQGQIELRSTSNNTPAIGFHRSGYTASTIYESGAQLYINQNAGSVQTGKIVTSSQYFDQPLYIRYNNPTVYLRDTDHNSAMLHCNSDLFYVLRGGDDTTAWTHNGTGRWPLICNLTNSNVTIGGNGYINGTTAITSDERLKTNIQSITGALDTIKALRGVTFYRTDINQDQLKSGLIAQEVEPVLPHIVDETVQQDLDTGEAQEETRFKCIAYEELHPYLIEAIKEQQALIEALTARIEALENP